VLETVLKRAREGRVQAEEDLFELLAIPSVSALPEHRNDCRWAASWLMERLERMGMSVELVDRDPEGNPVIMAEWLGREGAPTLTIYGHYDVQPPDPLEEWNSPPFQPTVRDGYVYARGADDNKGQHMAGVEAARRRFPATRSRVTSTRTRSG
jgi:acetylornithine deacetylase/succinyl-diaminopimelate desuccinylase-like protein